MPPHKLWRLRQCCRSRCQAHGAECQCCPARRYCWNVLATGPPSWRAIATGLLIVTFLLLLSWTNPCHETYFDRLYPTLGPGDNVNLTVVTAYFHLGAFQKGEARLGLTFTPQGFFRSAGSFRFLQNPLVVYTDSQDFADFFWAEVVHPDNRAKVRVILLDRQKLPAFRDYRERVKIIFDDPTYPKYYPNTVNADYACSQHAKIDVVEDAMRQDVFASRYYAWLDLGYFHHLTASRRRKFWLAVPRELADDEIGLTEVTSRDASLTPLQIFGDNLYWLAGGMVLGSRQAYARYIRDYRQAVELFLGHFLANTDQQVIYSMFSQVGRHQLRNQTTRLRTWHPFFWDKECWYHLGYVCYKEEARWTLQW